MLTAIVLSIGDELVLGQTVDTNSAWLSAQLAVAGCAVLAHVTVPDDQAAIQDAIARAASRCDLLLVSGGIGPTPDDLTRQALASVMNVPLDLDDEWLAHLEDFFRQRGRPMPDMNRIQAMIPRGSTLLWNHAGTAAGIAATLDPRRIAHPTPGDAIAADADAAPSSACRVFVMPGVPKEMKVMFERDVLPHAHARGGVILSRTLHTFGQGESTVAEQLGDLMRRDRNPSVGTTVSAGVVSLRLNARFPTRDEAQRQLDDTDAACRRALGTLIYGQDDDTLAATVGGLLRAAGKTVTTAESCTGGLLAAYLTDAPGSSNYFNVGFVTYSNQAKYERLGVPTEVLNLYGAVSEPVVRAMAQAARRLANADFALAISGIAGPGGGSAAKPVGTVCIALAHDGGTAARTFVFTGDREMVRDRSAKMALTLLRFHLLGQPLPF